MKTLLTVFCLAASLCFAQQDSSQDMKGMNMPGHDMSQMGHDSGEDSDAGMHAMHSMEGHHIFLPNVPQKQYHFTNYRYGFEAAFSFNPEHPTSLLYEKNGDGYRLVGLMYTAPKRFTEDDLNARIPLSIAQWHEHVNFCKAPEGRRMEALAPNPKFGLRGSITTQAECDAAGGKFLPIVFNWMVHLYPNEKDTASVWSVDRQHAD
jgi:hypothetical protein